MVNLNMNILSKDNYEDSEYDLAVSIIKHENENGVKKIIVAQRRSNYEENLSVEEMKYRIDILSKKLDENKINIKIYPADSVKISEKNIKDCLSGKFQCINESRYILIDLDDTMTKEQLDMIYELSLIDLVPVIQHPERCIEIIENIKKIDELKELGCLF